jgi:hypothetical protein
MKALEKYPTEVLQAMFSKMNATEKAIWSDMLDMVDQAEALVEISEQNEKSIAELEALAHQLTGGESH